MNYIPWHEGQATARAVRFKSRGRGLDSVEGKRNDTGMRFVLQPGEQGNQGVLVSEEILCRNFLTQCGFN